MRQPICVRCQVQMQLRRIGVDVELMAAEMPYQIWNGYLWRCPGCQVEVVCGFGNTPITEHFHKRFAAIAKAASLRFWGSMEDQQVGLGKQTIEPTEKQS